MAVPPKPVPFSSKPWHFQGRAVGQGYILSVSAFPTLHSAWHHSRTSEVLLELKVWPQAPGAVWVCRVPRHVGAQRVSCLRIVTLNFSEEEMEAQGGEGHLQGHVTHLWP